MTTFKGLPYREIENPMQPYKPWKISTLHVLEIVRLYSDNLTFLNEFDNEISFYVPEDIFHGTEGYLKKYLRENLFEKKDCYKYE